MATPIKPSQFIALVPAPNVTLAAAILNLMKFALLFYQWYAYTFSTDATLSPAFQRDICNNKANC